MKKNEYPDKDQLIQFYITELHTIQECADHFNIGKTKMYRALKLYGIKRSKEDKSKVYSRAQNSEETQEIIRQSNLAKYGACYKATLDSPIQFIDANKFSVNGCEYTTEWLRNQYIDNNLTSEQMSNQLGISYVQLNRICRHYQIFKDSSKRYEIIQRSVIDKYGVISTLQLDDVKEKSHQTVLRKYGVDNCMQNDTVKEHIRQSNIAKYGVDNNKKIHIVNLDKWEKDDEFVSFINSYDSNHLPTIRELCNVFNLNKTSILRKMHKLHLEDKIDLRPRRSHYEDEIKDFLENEAGVSHIIQNDWDALDDYEIDIYLPDYQIGIEFNGDYWHSDIWPRYQDHNGRSTTHQNKSLLAESKGIFLFHIFENEWNDSIKRENIKSRLKTILMKNVVRIPARKCQIIELTKKQKKEFLDVNHIQGNDHATKQYGLIYNDELVACMTFVHPKNNKYTWELSRFCNKHGSTVQGGASKLFKHFVKTLNKGDTISSYNDITKTKGDLYKILGFECVSINQPNYVWINFVTGDIRSRYQEQAGGEVERMHNAGYHRVCDCGTKTWVYKVI